LARAEITQAASKVKKEKKKTLFTFLKCTFSQKLPLLCALLELKFPLGTLALKGRKEVATFGQKYTSAKSVLLKRCTFCTFKSVYGAQFDQKVQCRAHIDSTAHFVVTHVSALFCTLQLTAKVQKLEELQAIFPCSPW